MVTWPVEFTADSAGSTLSWAKPTTVESTMVTTTQNLIEFLAIDFISKCLLQINDLSARFIPIYC
jgi:hypothetical protein